MQKEKNTWVITDLSVNIFRELIPYLFCAPVSGMTLNFKTYFEEFGGKVEAGET